MASHQPPPSADTSTDGVVTLEMLKPVLQTVLDANPIYSFLLSDMELTSVHPGLITATVPVTTNLLNSHNILHGCTSATIIDLMGGICVASTSPSRFNRRGVSVDIHISYAGAAREGETLLVTAKANKVGSRLAFVDVEIKARREQGGEERVVVSGSHTKFVG